MKGISRRLARLEARAGDSAWQHGEGIANLLQHIPPLEESEREAMREAMRALKEKPRGITGLLWEIYHVGADGCPVGEEPDHASGA